MATKAQVIKKAKQQGAKFEWENSETFSIWLPEGKIWDSGYGVGQVVQEKMYDETWPQFWDGFMSVINAPVIDE